MNHSPRNEFDMSISTTSLPTIADLGEAIALNEIEPAFQPLIDIERERTVGYEVLARWNHLIYGPVSPSFFVKLAEDNGLIYALTAQIIQKACECLRHVAGEPFVAFNLSPIQLREEGIVDLVSQILVANDLSFSRIHIEITESALIEDEETALRIVRRFKEFGFGLALDDFGTGFSSLTRLHALPFDKLKIDARFVRRMEEDPTSRKIVASVIDLGQSLGMTVVAEGVETYGQLALLRRLGCDVAQGFFLGRPVESKPQANPAYPAGSLRCSRLNPSRRQKLFQLEAIYRSSPNALAFLDCEGRLTRANERFGLIVGKPVADIVGTHLAGLLPQKHELRVDNVLRHVRRGREIDQLELFLPHSQRTYVASCTRVIDDENELIGISLSLMDVSRRKNAEALLRADEDQFRRAVEQGLHIVWAAKPTGEVYYMGPTLVGGGVAVSDRIADWYSRMHPDDRIIVRREWLDWIPTGRPFVTRFRIRGLDGAWLSVTSSASPKFSDDGVIEDWVGVITSAIP